MARRRFFVDSFQEGSAELSGEDASHLARVLRAEPGQQFELSDNRSVQLAEIVDASPRRVRFRLIQALPEAPSPVRVILLAALIKFDRFEWMLEKATELGVAAIQPVEASRTERGLLQAATKRVDRWRRLAREASQQSRRVTMPEVADPVRLGRVDAARFPLRYLLDENPAAQPIAHALPPDRPSEALALLIGPEGGWTPAEREQLTQLWTPVSMGTQILRAETAALAALAVVMNRW